MKQQDIRVGIRVSVNHSIFGETYLNRTGTVSEVRESGRALVTLDPVPEMAIFDPSQIEEIQGGES
jgi:hypothetical protein